MEKKSDLKVKKEDSANLLFIKLHGWAQTQTFFFFFFVVLLSDFSLFYLTITWSTVALKINKSDLAFCSSTIKLKTIVDVFYTHCWSVLINSLRVISLRLIGCKWPPLRPVALWLNNTKSFVMWVCCCRAQIKKRKYEPGHPVRSLITHKDTELQFTLLWGRNVRQMRRHHSRNSDICSYVTVFVKHTIKSISKFYLYLNVRRGGSSCPKGHHQHPSVVDSSKDRT